MEQICWRPIEEYFKGPYDYVLVKLFDGESEIVPQVAAYNNVLNKWLTPNGDEISLEVKEFADIKLIPESLSEVDLDELANIGISNYQDIVRAVIAFIKKKEAYWKSMISKYLIKGDVSKDRVLAECNAASEIRLLIETLIDTYSDKLN